MARKKRAPAVAYLRTSSASNVGADKDSDKRQAEAIRGFAARVGYEVVDTYYDAAVSGADPLETRPGFAALLDRIENNGVRTVLVEDASRLARDLITQETGIVSLVERGVTVLTPAATTSRRPTTTSKWRCGRSRAPSLSLRRPGWSPSSGTRESGSARSAEV